MVLCLWQGCLPGGRAGDLDGPAFWDEAASSALLASFRSCMACSSAESEHLSMYCFTNWCTCMPADMFQEAQGAVQ